ncbi:Type II secretion system F domain [Moorella glycerini]|uniref:Type II secretion system protein F n=1 Tax=Neomoorella stamsii TaxID=1266720 RepID=A0A9X7J5H4_9FIRM|nr:MULTISPECIES: type II secretion system F family protein [Moorella]PRR77750.1 putative type II secretion system protein F [Moorella stamsii]CEP66033.1 Type II secretion system F domain [Moorella glycerini]
MNFAYRGRDARGNAVSGNIEAESQELAIRELRRQGIFITYCRPAVVTPARDWRRLFRRPVSRRDLALFSRQLATMLGAGLPIVTALHILQRQAENPSLRESIGMLLQDLESGEAFYRALERQPRVFPPIFIHTVEAGELGGALDETLERLAGHLEREHEVEEKVKSALTYPAIVSMVALLAVIFLLTYVLPSFQVMLNSLQVPLPWPTRLVLGISSGLRYLWPVLFLFLAGAAYGFYRWLQKPAGRYRFDRMLLRIPIFGPLHQKTVLSRFSRTLGTLLHSGVPVLPALEIVRRTVGNAVVAGAVERAAESVRDGQSLAAPLEASGVFPPMVVEMITVGEETGALDALLAKISSFYDREVGETVARLSSLIEPVLIVTLGGIIGLVVISVLLPVFSLVGGVR